MRPQPAKQRSLQAVAFLARASYGAKAIFYGGLALFTLEVALGSARTNPTRKAVLERLMSQPLGKGVLALMALAFAGHTVWRVIEIGHDPYRKGKGIGGWLYRLNYLLSAITYGSLGITALKLLTGQGDGQPHQKQIWVAGLLQRDGGAGLVIGVGGLLLTWAGIQLYKGVSGRVYQSLVLDGWPGWGKDFLRICGLLGFVTVGGTLAATGGYLIKGGLARDPHWVKNTDELIRELQGLPGGQWLQGGAGLGFLLMAVFMVAMARYFPLKTID